MGSGGRKNDQNVAAFYSCIVLYSFILYSYIVTFYIVCIVVIVVRRSEVFKSFKLLYMNLCSQNADSTENAPKENLYQCTCTYVQTTISILNILK